MQKETLTVETATLQEKTKQTVVWTPYPLYPLKATQLLFEQKQPFPHKKPQEFSNS